MSTKAKMCPVCNGKGYLDGVAYTDKEEASMAEPTHKHPAIEAMMDQILGHPGARAESIKADICVPAPIGCGGPASIFDNDLSAKEYTISGLCQKCQDRVFVGKGR